MSEVYKIDFDERDMDGNRIWHEEGGTMTDAPAFEKTPDELIAETLSRYTVRDLVEQADADLDAAADRFAKDKPEIKIVKRGKENFIHWWRIISDGIEYECRRFENFVWCSCLGFFYTKKVCKHIYQTTKEFERIERQKQDDAPYLKPSRLERRERIGGIVI